jgi:hypothetical protein
MGQMVVVVLPPVVGTKEILDSTPHILDDICVSPGVRSN